MKTGEMLRVAVGDPYGVPLRNGFALPATSLVLLLLTGVLGACAPGAADLPTLQRDPAAALRMPEATELGHFFSEQRFTPEGPVDAYDVRVFGIQLSEAAVLDYYQREMAKLGWKSDQLYAFHSTAELRAWAWCKSTMTARLAIKDTASAFQPDFYRGQDFQTVFEAGIRGRDPKIEACPG
jgi:hypothetical protein